jgi:hypothetical protein
MHGFETKIHQLLNSWSSLPSFSANNLASKSSEFTGKGWTEGSWNTTASALISQPSQYITFIKDIQHKVKLTPLSPPVPRIETGQFLFTDTFSY